MASPPPGWETGRGAKGRVVLGDRARVGRARIAITARASYPRPSSNHSLMNCKIENEKRPAGGSVAVSSHLASFSVDGPGIFVDPSNDRLSARPACAALLTHPPRVPAMLDLATGRTADCSGLNRRTFLRLGGLAAFGLSLPQYLKAMADAPGAKAKAKRCILLWMQGGPSHIDSFDPKPDAPAEIRGEFGTVPTTLPGVRFADPLPMLAQQTDRLAVIRGHDPKNG